MYVIQGSVAWTLVNIPRWSWVQTAKLAAKLKGLYSEEETWTVPCEQMMPFFSFNIMNNLHYATDTVFGDVHNIPQDSLEHKKKKIRIENLSFGLKNVSIFTLLKL